MDTNITDLLNVLYLAKMLDDMDKLGIIEPSLTDELDYDTISEISFRVIENLFECSKNFYFEDRNYDYQKYVISDRVLTDYYKLAEEYGKINKREIEDNPYFTNDDLEARKHFTFSYSLSWKIFKFPNSRRPFKSRLEIFIDTQDYVDICGVAIGVVSMYQYYSEKCEELRKILVKQELIAA